MANETPVLMQGKSHLEHAQKVCCGKRGGKESQRNQKTGGSVGDGHLHFPSVSFSSLFRLGGRRPFKRGRK